MNVIQESCSRKNGLPTSSPGVVQKANHIDHQLTDRFALMVASDTSMEVTPEPFNRVVLGAVRR